MWNHAAAQPKHTVEKGHSHVSPKSKKRHHDEVDAKAEERIKELEVELAAQKKIASAAVNAAKSSTEGLVSKASAYSTIAEIVKAASCHP